MQDFTDIYARIIEIVAASPVALEAANVVGTHFAMASRYYLTVGVADCLRCHLKDSYAKTRMAIENAAFAARVQRHPQFADAWRDAGQGPEEYQEYRDKFRKLFPADHQILKLLGDRYDFCAKQTHPSIYSFAGRSRVEQTDTTFDFKLEYFEAQPDGSEPVRTFFFTLNTHMLITDLYRDALAKALVGDAKALAMRANSIEAKYLTQIHGWAERIPALKPFTQA